MATDWLETRNVEGYDPEKAGLEEGDAKFTRTFIVDTSSDHVESGEVPVTVMTPMSQSSMENYSSPSLMGGRPRPSLSTSIQPPHERRR